MLVKGVGEASEELPKGAEEEPVVVSGYVDGGSESVVM